jgi:hypothetical protein
MQCMHKFSMYGTTLRVVTYVNTEKFLVSGAFHTKENSEQARRSDGAEVKGYEWFWDLNLFFRGSSGTNFTLVLLCKYPSACKWDKWAWYTLSVAFSLTSWCYLLCHEV